MARKPTGLDRQIEFKYVENDFLSMDPAGLVVSKGHKHFSSETVQLPVLHLWYNKGQVGV